MRGTSDAPVLYQREYQHLTGDYVGSFETTDGLQAYLIDQQRRGVTGSRLKAMQSIINRHLDPRPQGPAVRLVG